MSRWPIFLSYLLGTGALWSVWLGDQVWRTPDPRGAIVCWIGAFMLVLGCMTCAQMDGHRMVSPEQEKP